MGSLVHVVGSLENKVSNSFVRGTTLGDLVGDLVCMCAMQLVLVLALHVWGMHIRY